MSNDPKQIRENFNNPKWHDLCGLGIPTGVDNDIFVVDGDTKLGHGKDGLAALEVLQAEHGPLPDTLMSVTPTGSVHRYYKHPGNGIKIKSMTLVPGVDIKGDGGQVAAPPSRFRAGFDVPYRWLNNLPICEAPPWLIELVQEQPRSQEAYSGPVTADVEELRDALRFVPNPDDWIEWKNIALRIYALVKEKGWEPFHEWSQRWDCYNPRTGPDDDLECSDQVKGSPPDRTGGGYIFKIARDNGWVRKGEPTYAGTHTPPSKRHAMICSGLSTISFATSMHRKAKGTLGKTSTTSCARKE